MFEFRLRALVAMMVVTATSLAAPAVASTDGLVFRALGFYRGTQNISDDSISCEIPTTSSAIADGGHQMGIWNSYGFETVSYPDEVNPFGNPCGGWVQLQNNMRTQGINLTRVVLHMKLPGSKRFRDQVPTRRNWPTACKGLRKQVLFLGARMDPVGSIPTGGSGSGAPNVVFLQLFPMLPPETLTCLRDQYDSLDTTSFSSMPLVFKARAYGMTDSGDQVQTQNFRYTLTLRHQCGNARVDNGEQCDPAAPFNSCVIEGEGADDPPIVGSCEPQGIPSECLCVFPIQ